MGICWYCHWGWAKPVAEIFLEAKKELGDNDLLLTHGPGHIVWDDENFGHAQWCLDHFDEYKNDLGEDWEWEIVKKSLEKLAKLPLEQVEIEPEDYDGKHPELFPPDVEVVKV